MELNLSCFDELEQQIDAWKRGRTSNLGFNTLPKPTEKWMEEIEVRMEILRQKSVLYSLCFASSALQFVRIDLDVFVPELVKGNNYLTVLLLNDIGLYDYPIASIFEALRDNPNSSLEKIDLSGNYVKDFGLKAIAKTLKTNTSLQKLVCMNCKIGDEGAIAFSDALKINSTLYSIDVRGNKISTEGIKALADAMEINTTIIIMMY